MWLLVFTQHMQTFSEIPGHFWLPSFGPLFDPWPRYQVPPAPLL